VLDDRSVRFPARCHQGRPQRSPGYPAGRPLQGAHCPGTVPIRQLQVKEIRSSIWGHCNLTWVPQAVLRIRDVYPDPIFSHPESTHKK